MAASSTIAAYAAVASAVTGAVGAVSAGQARQDQAKFRARVAEQRAKRERQVAKAKETDFRRRQSRLMAARRASLGASGVESGTGSTLLATEDFAAESELQALRIRNSGEARATRLDQSAGLQRAAGRNASRRGAMRAGASLLSGLGQAERAKPGFLELG